MSDQLTRDLEILVELFKSGGWRELRVEGADFSVLFSTDSGATSLGAAPTSASASGQQPGEARPSITAAPPAAVSSAPTPVDPAWHAVTAPNLGTFYRSPKPGADSFVEIGAHVAPETEICLLEVMKLFTSVKAGVAGKIVSIAAADAELVEGGQLLFYIDTD